MTDRHPTLGQAGFASCSSCTFWPVPHRQRGRPMLFTTNKPPLTAWGDVLQDHDLSEAIVDRVLKNGGLLLLDGPS